MSTADVKKLPHIEVPPVPRNSVVSDTTVKERTPQTPIHNKTVCGVDVFICDIKTVDTKKQLIKHPFMSLKGKDITHTFQNNVISHIKLKKTDVETSMVFTQLYHTDGSSFCEYTDINTGLGCCYYLNKNGVYHGPHVDEFECDESVRLLYDEGTVIRQCKFIHIENVERLVHSYMREVGFVHVSPAKDSTKNKIKNNLVAGVVLMENRAIVYSLVEGAVTSQEMKIKECITKDLYGQTVIDNNWVPHGIKLKPSTFGYLRYIDGDFDINADINYNIAISDTKKGEKEFIKKVEDNTPPGFLKFLKSLENSDNFFDLISEYHDCKDWYKKLSVDPIKEDLFCTDR